jgi:hypothetical protein
MLCTCFHERLFYDTLARAVYGEANPKDTINRELRSTSSVCADEYLALLPPPFELSKGFAEGGQDHVARLPAIASALWQIPSPPSRYA